MLIPSGGLLILLQPPALESVSSAFPVLNGACLPGFCPVVSASGPPPGLMFLALGLVAYGLGGLWQGRKAVGRTGDQ